MIAVRDEVYDVLSSLKLKGESFSNLLLRLAGRKKDGIMQYAGAWSDWPESKGIFKRIAAERKKAKMRDAKW